MSQLTEHKLHKILTRFPWRRRRPRSARRGQPPVSMTTREGQRLWADAKELVAFDDPGPALVCVAIHNEPLSRTLVRGLVEHYAEVRGIALPDDVPGVTTTGLEILGGLIEDAGLDPDEPLGSHPIGDLLTATWAIAAASDDSHASAV